MKTNMLRAFILEMGHEYEEDEATETSDDDSNPLALTAANQAIFSNFRMNEEDPDDDLEDADEGNTETQAEY